MIRNASPIGHHALGYGSKILFNKYLFAIKKHLSVTLISESIWVSWVPMVVPDQCSFRAGRHRSSTISGTIRSVTLVVSISLLIFSGCGGTEIETKYGRSRGKSVNGINVVVDLLRQRGHETRSAVRLTPQLEEWADVLVRFSQSSGPLRNKEANWYSEWLSAEPERRLVYVLNDYSAEADYWNELLKTTLTVSERNRAAVKRDNAKPVLGSGPLLTPAKTKAKSRSSIIEPDDSPVDPILWFEIDDGDGPHDAKTLEGPWAEGVDPRAANIMLSRSFKPQDEESARVLLSAEGKPIAIELDTFGDHRVLVIANGSFLVNGALLNKARRPLTDRVLDWIDESGPSTKVATVEGAFVTSSEPKERTLFELAQIFPFNWISAQLLVLTVITALVLAPRLGRPFDPPTASNAERPAAHPEALGTLMARSVPPDDAREILATYRQWRNATPRTGRSGRIDK